MEKKEMEKKPRGRPFEKGNKLSKGGQKLPAALKAVRYLSHDQVAEMGTILLEGNVADVKAIASDPNASFLKRWTATMAVKGMVTGDVKVWEAVLNRVVGPMKQRLEISGDPVNPVQVRAQAMSPEERRKFIMDAAKDIQDALDVE
jgi:hypothetical protein